MSARGMLMADVIKDYSLTVMKNGRSIETGRLETAFFKLEKKGTRDLFWEGVKLKDHIMERSLDMRYHGQAYEIMVPFDRDYIQKFHSLHEKRYGYRNENQEVEIVNIRLRWQGAMLKLPSVLWM